MANNNNQRESIIDILKNIERAHDELTNLAESYKRDEAADLLIRAHQATALLLVSK